MKRLFHLVPPSAWRDGRTDGAWRPDSLDREGFVHLSFGEQIAGTLALHFAHATELLLFEVDARRVAADVVLEPARGGARFAHLYRALESEDVLRYWTLEKGPSGWNTPQLDAPHDRPTGRAGTPQRE